MIITLLSSFVTAMQHKKAKDSRRLLKKAKECRRILKKPDKQKKTKNKSHEERGDLKYPNRQAISINASILNIQAKVL